MLHHSYIMIMIMVMKKKEKKETRRQRRRKGQRKQKREKKLLHNYQDTLATVFLPKLLFTRKTKSICELRLQRRCKERNFWSLKCLDLILSSTTFHSQVMYFLNTSSIIKTYNNIYMSVFVKLSAIIQVFCTAHKIQ